VRRIIYVVWLVAVWVALWNDISVANIASGLLVATALLWIFRSAGPYEASRVQPVALVSFLCYFLVELVKATGVVAWEAVSPRSRINEGVVAVDLAGTSHLVVTLVANAITLTPGTLTIDARTHPGGATLYVHVLHLRDIESVRADVQKLEDRALKALGSSARSDSHDRAEDADARAEDADARAEDAEARAGGTDAPAEGADATGSTSDGQARP
jgi:multicomponent Na+:H+ antiporter subunit E